MEHTQYILFVSQGCIEGFKMKKKSTMPSISSEHSSFPEAADLPKDATVFDELDLFLETHHWRKAHTVVIVPTEEVSFRTLNFPFQDRKKIQQVLKFEVQNEVMGDAENLHYTYDIRMLPENKAQAHLYFIDQPYLDQLREVFDRYDIFLKDVVFAGHALFKMLPLFDNSRQYQVYVGADETFVNVVENRQLQTVKFFPTYLKSYLKELASLNPVDVETLSKAVGKADSDDPQLQYSISQKTVAILEELRIGLEQKFTKLIEEEIQRLCRQLNLFLRTSVWNEDAEVSISGIFSSIVIFNGKKFEPAPGAVTELVGLREEQWGILRELKHGGLHYLEKSEITFYSEKTSFGRFLLRKYYGVAVIGIILLLLTPAGWMGRFLLEQQRVQQMIERTDRLIEAKIQQLLPQETELSIQAAMVRLEEKIEKKQQLIENGKQFQKRDYKNLEMLSKLSQVMKQSAVFRVDRLEWSKDQFLMNGQVDSYDSLELLRTGLEELEEFKNHEFLINNTKTKEGIIYRISVRFDQTRS